MQRYTLLAMLLLITVTTNGWAKQPQHFYYGIKGGAYEPRKVGYENDKTALGIQWGYDYGNDWSLELEYMGGELALESATQSAVIGIDTWGLYATYRAPEMFYYMVKMGMSYKKSDAAAEVNKQTGDSSHISYGLGGGFRFNDHVTIEGEYTVIEDKLHMMAGTLRYRF